MIKNLTGLSVYVMFMPMLLPKAPMFFLRVLRLIIRFIDLEVFNNPLKEDYPMFLSFAHRPKFALARKVVSSVMAFAFLTNLATPAGAQLASLLPTPGSAVTISPVFMPPLLKGVLVHPENPFLFDFVVSPGQDKVSGQTLKDESQKLVKFFLTAMTIPDKEAWVNLSPYEKDRIIPPALGETQMGQVMLEQDYALKQMSSAMTDPRTELGAKFWQTVRQNAQAKLGTTDVPMSTFNKVWIVPGKAEVAQEGGQAYVTESSLKVMMEEDYEALQKTVGNKEQAAEATQTNKLTSEVFRTMILPKLEQNVNTSKEFSGVRQIYEAAILAVWYKQALKESLLGKIYADKSKVKGIESLDKDYKQGVYARYLEAFKQGAYNFIREEADASGEVIPRRYFSGGAKMIPAEITRGNMNGVAGSAIKDAVVVSAAVVETQQEGAAVQNSVADKVAASAVNSYSSSDEFANALKLGLDARVGVRILKAVILEGGNQRTYLEEELGNIVEIVTDARRKVIGIKTDGQVDEIKINTIKFIKIDSGNVVDWMRRNEINELKQSVVANVDSLIFLDRSEIIPFIDHVNKLTNEALADSTEQSLLKLILPGFVDLAEKNLRVALKVPASGLMVDAIKDYIDKRGEISNTDIENALRLYNDSSRQLMILQEISFFRDEILRQLRFITQGDSLDAFLTIGYQIKDEVNKGMNRQDLRYLMYTHLKPLVQNNLDKASAAFRDGKAKEEDVQVAREVLNRVTDFLESTPSPSIAASAVAVSRQLNGEEFRQELQNESIGVGAQISSITVYNADRSIDVTIQNPGRILMILRTWSSNRNFPRVGGVEIQAANGSSASYWLDTIRNVTVAASALKAEDKAAIDALAELIKQHGKNDEALVFALLSREHADSFQRVLDLLEKQVPAVFNYTMLAAAQMELEQISRDEPGLDLMESLENAEQLLLSDEGGTLSLLRGVINLIQQFDSSWITHVEDYVSAFALRNIFNRFPTPVPTQKENLIGQLIDSDNGSNLLRIVSKLIKDSSASSDPLILVKGNLEALRDGTAVTVTKPEIMSVLSQQEYLDQIRDYVVKVTSSAVQNITTYDQGEFLKLIQDGYVYPGTELAQAIISSDGDVINYSQVQLGKVTDIMKDSGGRIIGVKVSGEVGMLKISEISLVRVAASGVKVTPEQIVTIRASIPTLLNKLTFLTSYDRAKALYEIDDSITVESQSGSQKWVMARVYSNLRYWALANVRMAFDGKPRDVLSAIKQYEGLPSDQRRADIDAALVVYRQFERSSDIFHAQSNVETVLSNLKFLSEEEKKEWYDKINQNIEKPGALTTEDQSLVNQQLLNLARNNLKRAQDALDEARRSPGDYLDGDRTERIRGFERDVAEAKILESDADRQVYLDERLKSIVEGASSAVVGVEKTLADMKQKGLSDAQMVAEILGRVDLYRRILYNRAISLLEQDPVTKIAPAQNYQQAYQMAQADLPEVVNSLFFANNVKKLKDRGESDEDAIAIALKRIQTREQSISTFAKHLADSKLGLSKKQQEGIIRVIEAGVESGKPAQEIVQELKARLVEITQALFQATASGSASSTVTAEQITALAEESLRLSLGFDPSENPSIEEVVNRYLAQTDVPREVQDIIDMLRNDDGETIREKYDFLVEQQRPIVMRSRGVSDASLREIDVIAAEGKKRLDAGYGSSDVASSSAWNRNQLVEELAVLSRTVAREKGRLFASGNAEEVLSEINTSLENASRLMEKAGNSNDTDEQDELFSQVDSLISEIEALLNRQRDALAEYNDASQNASSQVGGINFDPTLMNLQVKRDKNGVPLPLPQQDLQNINIEGLYPVIINIAPATMANFPLLSKAAEEKQKIPSDKDDLSPMDRQKTVALKG